MSSVLLTQRSFGGKSGTWFRKRRLPESSLLISSFQKKLHSNSDPQPIQAPKRGARSQPTLATGNSASLLIGWDDIRCRPVYRDNSIETKNERLEGQDNEKRAELSASRKTKPTSLTKRKEVGGGAVQPPLKRSRSYGGSRRHRKISEDDDNEDFEAASNAPQSSKEIETAAHDREAKATTSKSVPIPTTLTDNSIFEFQDEFTEEENNCKTPPKEPVQSVSSKTSLSVAKEFFRKLDSEDLTISAEPSTSPKRNPTRSSRHISAKANGVLQKEYCEYTAACKDSSVTPLCKEKYASNRGSFFRSHEIYDGFLDE